LWSCRAFQSRCAGWAKAPLACAPTHPAISSGCWRNSALSLFSALPRLLLATLLLATLLLATLLLATLLLATLLLARLLLATLLLARLLLSAVALLAALILLAWLLFVGVHNCSFVSSLSNN